MDAPNKEFALAGSLEELKAKGRLVMHGGDRPILVIYDRGRVFALDNRCPHMGFPLERYDAVGRWRETYSDGKPVHDASALADKTPMSGVDGLLAYLQTQEKQVLRTMSKKLVGYALGRTILLSDQPLIDRLMSRGSDITFSRLATDIVCAVTRLTSSVLNAPYAVVRPYSTSELLTSSVVQLTVAPVDVMEETATDEITGRSCRFSATGPRCSWPARSTTPRSRRTFKAR